MIKLVFGSQIMRQSSLTKFEMNEGMPGQAFRLLDLGVHPEELGIVADNKLLNNSC